MTRLKMVAGSAGNGKSTKLIEQAINASLQRKSVYIMTPTHTAKDNIKKGLNEKLQEEYGHVPSNQLRIKMMQELVYKVHVGLNSYRGEEIVLIDEMSMVDMTTFKALFWDMKNLDNAEITAYGDIKQLPAVRENSFAEVLFRNNISDSFWDWTKQAYDEDMVTLIAPESWELEDRNVELEILTHNYRLNKLGFDSYDESYIDTLLENTIYYSNESDYEKIIVHAINNYVLIITPTHARGEEVNDYVYSYFDEESESELSPFEVFPFVKLIGDTKVYLNPNHHDLAALKSAFDFVSEVPKGFKMSKAEYTAYIVVNVAQGATVDNAVYYMGNTPIPDGKVQSFYNYNRLFTAITRSRNLTQLVGDKREISRQLDIFPESAQQRLEYRHAKETVSLLFDHLYALSNALTKEEVYELYMKLFNEELPNAETRKQLEMFDVVSTPYTPERLALAFKDYDDSKVLNGMVDYKSLLYKKHVSEVNGSNKKGKTGGGKVQKWIDSLEDKTEVRTDVEELSVRKFKAKYGMEKKNVTKALGM